MDDEIMKASAIKRTTKPAIAVFPKMLHRVRPNSEKTTPLPKAPKRDNVFSKSRDLREDRGERQMKTTHNPQSMPHGR